MQIRIFYFVLVAMGGIAGCSGRAAQTSSVPNEANDLVDAGARVLVVSRFVDFADSVRAMQVTAGDTTPRQLGTQLVAEHVTTENGAPAILFTKRSEGRGVLFTDTLLMLRDGLTPVWEHMRSGHMLKDIRYAGDRLHQQTYIGDSLARSKDSHFPHRPFGFNQLDMVVRSLPLRTGFHATLPLYSEGDDSVEVDTVSVIGLKSGPPVQWTVRFADPVIVATYGIDTVTRRVTTYEVTNRKAGGRFWLVR
jgi:hypothetical protein